ncbi:MAG TPA: zf-HC2 domain-containing protein [Vicinamibacterales bacterium]|nr:zf-HC2 domain-containing protein [Vicinamibacterales bacterium]
MTTCAVHESGAIELYFYGELAPEESSRVEVHLRACTACARALKELEVIRVALASRPDVSAPPSGDWSAFMRRLDVAVRRDGPAAVMPFTPRRVRRVPLAGLLATAALLALVTLSVMMAARAGRQIVDVTTPDAVDAAGGRDMAPVHAALTSVGLTHLERSKLVVLGLATREPEEAALADWAYERELASALLNDTRLYRMAAEERGLMSLAGVMQDLELVLLQTAMAEGDDRGALPQIQRLIEKRGLLQKMDVVGTTGLLP